MAKPLTYSPMPYPQDTAQDDLKRLLETLHEGGVLRLLNGLIGQKDGVLKVALDQFDSEGGRNALATLTVLVKALTETNPDEAQDVWDGMKRGLTEAQATLRHEPPSLLTLLGKLGDPDVRRGLAAALSLLGGLGAYLHAAESHREV